MTDCTVTRISVFKHENTILHLGFKNTSYKIKFEYLVFLSNNSVGKGNFVVMETAANVNVSSTSTANEDWICISNERTGLNL